MATFVLRPSGTYVKELDLALQAKAISTSIAAIVMGSLRGPERDKFMTRIELFDLLYGPPVAAWSFAHYCIRRFLKEGQGAWITRVTNSARHAGSVVFNDQEGALSTKTFFRPFLTGRYANFESGEQDLYNFSFSSPLLAGQTLSATFSDNENGDNPRTVSTVFDTSHDRTLNVFAGLIQAEINNVYTLPGKNGGQAFVNKVGIEANDDRILTVMAPEDTTLYFTSFRSTRGTGDTNSVLPTVTVYEDSSLLNIYAENRGKWASDRANTGVGYRFANVDNGTRERILLRFSKALVNTQQLSVRMVFSDPTDNTDVDKTLRVAAVGTGSVQDHAAAIAALITAYKTEYPGGDAYTLGESNLEVVFVAPEAGKSTLVIRSATASSSNNGVTAPLFTMEEFLEGIPSTQSFDFEIYTRDDINEPKEVRRVSLIRQVNENGEQLYIEDVLNEDSVRSSNYIRVKHNRRNLSGLITVPPEGMEIQWLSGGDDGVLPTSGDLIRGWNGYADRRKRPARIFINGGYTALSVQQKMAALAKARYDAIAVLDYPSDKHEPQAAFEYRTQAHNINTSYAAIYLPNVKITDEVNSKDLFVPPSGHAAAVYARTDNVAASWFAPAGMNRAILEDALGLSYEYNAEDMKLLIDCQLNPIINRGGDIVIWEQFTAYRASSPFQNVSLRRMLILIEVSIVDGLDYTLHEPNDEYTGMLIVQIAISILQPVKEGRGLYAYAAISDDRNNSESDYNRQNRNLDILMDPILPIRTIQLTSVVTRKGASFAEVLNALQGNFATVAV